ncbi:MAG: FimB/Mfa2 family fimbrial subunit [Tannerellaceae bacterium]|nr:FimB/Mfa2 family fimbrial subunit [Tannerellaceae bacterium]
MTLILGSYLVKILKPYGHRAVALFAIYCSLFLFFSSCMREDLSLCEEIPSTSLSLTLVLEKETEEKIEDVQVLLFDSDSLLYQIYSVEVAGFGETGTITLPVDAGDYFVVALGNMPEEGLVTRAQTGSHFEEIEVLYPEEKGLFYAPFKEESRSRDYENYYVEVIENKDNVHTLSFLPAFHRIHVYVKGMEEEEGPEIRLVDVAAGYDLHLEPTTESTSYQKTPLITEREEEELFFSSFRVPHFDGDTPIRIEVENPVTGRADSIFLEEVLRKEEILPEDGAALTIEILFIYSNGVLVEVSFPQWDVTEIDPGF